MQFRHRLALASVTAVAAVAALPAGQASAFPPNPPPYFFCGGTVSACVNYIENLFTCTGAICPPAPSAPATRD